MAEFEGDKTCVEDLGAVNRWPARSEVPVEEYLRLWQTSCAEIDSPASCRLDWRNRFAPAERDCGLNVQVHSRCADDAAS